MPGHDVIVVGASAGGVEALARLVSRLPADLPASLFVVLHLPASGRSMLPQILSSKSRLSAEHPEDGAPTKYGRIYVAPPDRHLMVESGRVRLVRGPRENGHRPAVDVLFRSAARSYGARVIGVVLSGALDDGTAGLLAVKRRGGVAIVQDPAEALFAGMPGSALDNVDVDHCLCLGEMAPLLVQLAHEPVEAGGAEPVSGDMDFESELAKLDLQAVERDPRPGQPSVFTCPECHGNLWEIQDGELIRFRCRVGHAYSADSLQAGQSEALEAALWTALRALEEKAALARRLGTRARERGHLRAEALFHEQEHAAEHSAGLVRDVLVSGQVFAGGDPAVPHEGPRATTRYAGGGEPTAGS
jgi:two-component system chemotaxis response regulator CheB